MVNYQFNVQNCVLHYTIGNLSFHKNYYPYLHQLPKGLLNLKLTTVEPPLINQLYIHLSRIYCD